MHTILKFELINLFSLLVMVSKKYNRNRKRHREKIQNENFQTFYWISYQKFENFYDTNFIYIHTYIHIDILEINVI